MSQWENNQIPNDAYDPPNESIDSLTKLTNKINSKFGKGFSIASMVLDKCGDED